MRRHSLALLLLLAVALGACSRSPKGEGIATAGGNTGGAGTTNPVSDDPQERARQFTECMREQGVDMPDPEGDGTGKGAIRIGGPDMDKQKVAGAMEKCRQFLPNGGEPQPLSPEDLEKMRQHATCMRENGVPDFPDPDPNGGFAIEIPKGDMSAMEAAMEKCRQYMPVGPEKGKAG